MYPHRSTRNDEQENTSQESGDSIDGSTSVIALEDRKFGNIDNKDYGGNAQFSQKHPLGGVKIENDCNNYANDVDHDDDDGGVDNDSDDINHEWELLSSGHRKKKKKKRTRLTLDDFFDTLEKTVLVPIRALYSVLACKIYVGVLFYVATVSTLLVIAGLVTFIFYQIYLPAATFGQEVHLQFGDMFAFNRNFAEANGRGGDQSAHPDSSSAACPSFSTIKDAGTNSIPWNSPFANVNVSTILIQPGQVYDVFMQLDMPETESNVRAGNFIVDVRFFKAGTPFAHFSSVAVKKKSETEAKSRLKPKSTSAQSADRADDDFLESEGNADGVGSSNGYDVIGQEHTRLAPLFLNFPPPMSVPTLAHGRRIASLTYQSSLIRYAQQLVQLPLYVTGWKSERQIVRVPIIDNVQFRHDGRRMAWRNRNHVKSLKNGLTDLTENLTENGLPETATIQIYALSRLQIYAARLEFVAQFKGLRYLMSKYTFTTFIFLTTIFWMMEIATFSIAWIGLSLFTMNRTKTYGRPEEENDPFSGRKTQALRSSRLLRSNFEKKEKSRADRGDRKSGNSFGSNEVNSTLDPSSTSGTENQVGSRELIEPLTSSSPCVSEEEDDDELCDDTKIKNANDAPIIGEHTPVDDDELIDSDGDEEKTEDKHLRDNISGIDELEDMVKVENPFSKYTEEPEDAFS